jgi:ABC-type antimicrobial peptide transport system permease subunit
VLDADINPDKLNMRLSDKADYYTNLIHHSILLLKNYDADKTKNEIINKEKELNLFVIIKSYNDTMNDFFKEVHPIISYETVKNSIMLVFCLIGLIGSIFSLMNDNKKELGILVSIGVNNTKLTLIYSLQYLVFFILSYLSGILISFKIDETVFASGLKNTFTIFNIGTTFLVIIIILLLIVILLNKTLKRCLPVDLIGGFREWV